MASVSRSWLVVMAVACVVVCVFVGCDGGGGGGGKVLRGTVVETDFAVEAGKRVRTQGDVIVQCQTATIAGELSALESTGAGTDGGSITIEAQNDIVVTGQVKAGAGTGGAVTGNGGNGGKGGNVTLDSANGDVTLGGAVAAGQVRPRQAGSASLQSGNGGNGGNGTLGGAGGVGGDITIECPNGTWHITPGPNVLVVGNGGNGGTAALDAEALATSETTLELPNAGGNCGKVSGHIGDIDGVTIEDGPQVEGQPTKVVVFEEGILGGGAGGNAGSATSEVIAAAAARPGEPTVGPRQETEYNVDGADGGSGFRQGGDGGSVQYTAMNGYSFGFDATVRGGYGGEATWFRGPLIYLSYLAQDLHLTSRWARGGRGGNARAVAGNGPNGGPGRGGGPGGEAHASGGIGGTAGGVDRQKSVPGRGGDAYARGGYGGDGGIGSASTPGGKGGDAGKARAHAGPGGDGSVYWPDLKGAGGDAEARGGYGGDGGDGNPPGGGGALGTAYASPGEGRPEGVAVAINGNPGAAGKLITEPPPVATRNYGVVETQYDSYVMNLLRNMYTWSGQLVPNAVHPAATLPVSAYVVPGESAYMNAGRTRLWLGTDAFVHTVNNPLGAATDGPIFVIPSGSSSRVCTVWVDETRDLLYALPWWSSTLYVYENAATATTNKNPVRTITLVNLGGPGTGMTGDSAGDRLFIRTNNPGDPAVVGVVDNASTRTGAVTPDRKLTGIATSTVGTGIAYARQQDMLYVGMTNGVGRIGSASTANGNVTPTMIQGAATGITTDPVSLDVYGDSNVLFVAVNRAALLAFNNASTISGNAAFAKRDTSFSRLIGAATFVEP